MLSDDEDYRYKLIRVWDNNKPNAAVVMLNPSKADMLTMDRTVMNLTNYLVENDYGSMTIVNLFSYRTTNPKYLKQRDEIQEALNDEYIRQAFTDSDVIIVAWIRDKDKYVKRKKEVEKLLLEHKYKIKCFKDTKERKIRHPRDLTSDWQLVDYEFIYVNELITKADYSRS